MMHAEVVMPHLSAFALQLFDPRGRCNRRGLLLAAVLLLALQLAAGVALWTSGIGFDGHLALLLNAAFCWVGFAVVSKRLHDLGRSTWWVPTALLVWLAGAISLAVAIILVGDPEILTPGAPSYWVAFGVMLAPLLIGAVWLHVADGEPDDNRYGPMPAASGFSLPADAAVWHRQPAHGRPSAA
jgi:uncharacterized membrane protein YhaH (DUF805 family)